MATPKKCVSTCVSFTADDMADLQANMKKGMPMTVQLSAGLELLRQLPDKERIACYLNAMHRRRLEQAGGKGA